MTSNAPETIQARRQRLSSVPRACEGCKVRKIRCDRTVPCSNCQISKITCRHPNERTKGQLQVEKIANLEALVERLDRQYRDLESRLAAVESLPRTSVQAEEGAPSAGARPVEEGGHGGRLFEGPSSFANQSLQASAVLSASIAGDADPNIGFSVDYLQNTLHDSRELTESLFFLRSSASRPAPGPSGKHLPVTLVTSLLRNIRARRPIFLSSYAINDLQLVEGLCRKVYSSTTSQASIGQIACAHGVFFFVLKELIAMKDSLCQRFDLPAYLDQCEQTFVTALESYEVLVVPSFEHILALTMGMVKAQGEIKPSLYWSLASAAATQCHSLGYHRESTYRQIPSAKAESIRRLFWTVYVFDKNMSLVLGRVSNNMHSSQIDTRHPFVSTDSALRAWDESFIMGIRLAGLQERIFTSLYSSATAVAEPDERAALVREIAGDMERWYLDLKQINPTGINNPQVFAMSRGNWDISFYSTLTLLHHSSSAKTGSGAGYHISSECFSAARNSLLAHLTCFPQYQNSGLLSDGEYVNWILLFSSLTPFLVVFLHAIAAKDTESAELLSKVVGTLETFRRASKGSERLYQVCATFAQIAGRLMDGDTERLSSLSTVGTLEDTHMHVPSRMLEPSNTDSSPGPEFNSAIHLHRETFEDVFASLNHDGNLGVDMDMDSVFATELLDDWFTGQPFLGNRFDLEFGLSGAGEGAGAGDFRYFA
ncbi:Zn(II)2Cys6 transcription factor [Aspergillus mulundensis]|uniref:Zn(2)-C6 fungal-type domain-containing protein n=1 Tax=Aspergillus mulundensis TaxID=1810919 RepID=A0A3D8RLG2_9EURO|nr:hypothetical protein DSM5745_07303 [Aspergillus mulundensis]RDW74641.1 hypothetical protein DSM5745_07303 [Aspergillus mulundensis]